MKLMYSVWAKSDRCELREDPDGNFSLYIYAGEYGEYLHVPKCMVNDIYKYVSIMDLEE